VHSLSRLCTSIHSSALTQCIHPLVCITSTSIPASLRCTCFDIARQTFQLIVDIQGKPIIVHVGHYGQPTVTTKTCYTGRNRIKLVDVLQGKYSCSLSTTLKSVISKEPPMDKQTHYRDDQTMIRDTRIIKTSPYYQDKYLQERWKYSQTSQVRRKAC
jgi:hypothetical protein